MRSSQHPILTKNIKSNCWHIAGIGLLELMLALSIIAVIITLATRYFYITETSRKVKVSIESIQAMYAALEQYYTDTGTLPNKLDLLTKSAMLPDNFVSFANPWGKIDYTAKETSAALTFSNVPQSACANVYNKIIASYPASDYKISMPPLQDGQCASTDMKVCFFATTCD